MTERADKIIAALRTGHDRLAARVRTLSPEGLGRPTGASQWDLSQVLSHLGSGAEIGLGTLERGRKGAGAPDGEANKAIWARWDAMSCAERAEGFLRADEELVTAYESLTSRERADLRIDLGFLPEPVDVAGLGLLRLSELSFHAWDVEVSFDPAGALAPEATPLLFDVVPMYLRFAAKVDALGGRRAHLAVHLSGPRKSFGLDLGDTVRITEEPAQPDGVLTAPAEWWLRLVLGRHAPRHTPATVALTGDRVGLDDLRRVFPGF